MPVHISPGATPSSFILLADGKEYIPLVAQLPPSGSVCQDCEFRIGGGGPSLISSQRCTLPGPFMDVSAEIRARHNVDCANPPSLTSRVIYGRVHQIAIPSGVGSTVTPPPLHPSPPPLRPMGPAAGQPAAQPQPMPPTPLGVPVLRPAAPVEPPGSSGEEAPASGDSSKKPKKPYEPDKFKSPSDLMDAMRGLCK